MKRLLFFTCILVFLGLKAQDDIMAKKNEQVGDSLSIFTRINADSSTVSHQHQPQIIEDHAFARINITDLIKSEKINWYYTSSIKSLDEQVSPTDKEEPEEKNPTEYTDPEMGLDTDLKKKNPAALLLINEYVIAKLYLLKQIGYNITSEIGDRL
ncbi:MAG: hypothetical protein JXB60_04645, partial [Candidatus Cloacimonetes bacterium]|nr:hypothetical protein [Candidatus Cloacimonadota bacterium]